MKQILVGDCTMEVWNTPAYKTIAISKSLNDMKKEQRDNN